MTESGFKVATEPELGYGQLLRVLLRRRFWLMGVFCGTLSIGAFLTLIAKPTYQSSMQLLVQPNYQEKKQSANQDQFADSNVETDTATQLNLMRSSLLIQRAVDRLRPEYPDIKVKALKKSLAVSQVVEDTTKDEVNTKILQANYTDSDPVKTQKVLITLLQVYQDYNREQQELRLSNGLAFINQQLPGVRRNIIQAEGALERFRTNQNLINPEQQGKAVTDALNQIEQERRTIRAQYQNTLAQYEALQDQLSRSPQDGLIASRLSQSSRYQALLDEIQKTELALSQQRQRFTDDNPVTQTLIEQRQKQLALLQKEKRQVLDQDAAQVGNTGERLLTEGQLGTTDQDLATQLAAVQQKLLSMRAGDQSLAKTERQLRGQLNRFPGLMAEYNRLQPEVLTRQSTLEQLLEARQRLGLELAQGGFDWQVVEEPQLGEQTGPNIKQNLLLTAVVGFLLGGIVAFIREASDDAVHTLDELQKQVDLPLLGMIPELQWTKINEPIISLPFQRSQAVANSTIELIQWLPFRESLDLICKNIQLLNSAPLLSSIMVTSALAGEGKSTLALGLAMSAARSHQRVLLIDADLRRPSLHKQLNLPNDQGLSTLLESDTPIPSQSSTLPTEPYIDILTSGPTPVDPVKLLSSPRMEDLMAAFERNYDLVLLDAPPVLGMVDAIQAASFCSGVMLIGRIGRVTQTELTQAITMLSQLNMIGIVANGVRSPAYSYTRYTEQRRSPSFRLIQPLTPNHFRLYRPPV